MDKVQILLSTYNGEKYLEQQLESIFKQKNVLVDVLVRDDGSSDTTIQIIHAFQRKYPIRLITGSNIGFAKSFWLLVNEADDHDFYAFCDQDDYWLEDKLYAAILNIKRHECGKPILYTSNVVAVDENLNTLSDKGFPVDKVLSYADSLRISVLPGCTFVFNHKLLNQMKRYKKKLIAHDWLTYLIANSIGKVIYDPVSYIYYRIHSGNTIGIDSKIGNLVKKWKRFFKPSFLNARSYIARNVYELYGEMMDDENKKLTFYFANYQLKVSYMLQLFKYKEYRKITFLGLVILKRL